MSNESQRLKIAYLTAEDPKSKRSWSGTTYYMAQALQKHCGDVYYLGPINTFEKRVVGRIIHESSQVLFKKSVAYDRLLFVAKKHAKIAHQKLVRQSFDVIVAPIGATEVAYLETDIPIVIAKDATFALVQNYLPQFSNLLARSVQEGHIIEDMAYKRAYILLYPTEWAAQSAIEDYHVDAKKIQVVPLGANFEEIPPKEIALKKKKSDQCRLLFVGLGWERKGGDIAFETLLHLEELGIQAELIVCGCTPPEKFSHRRMKVIPYLDKSDEQQRKELENLYATSDFLLVPTRRDCYGLVFCEASAFGLPSITTDTGGVSGVVINGENGFRLPYSARGNEYAKIIAEIYCDDQRYASMVRSSRAVFEERLNWDAWGVAVKQIFTSILAGKTTEL